MLHMMPRAAGTGMREAVLRELASDPSVDQSEIGVRAEDGLVTLTGDVSSHDVRIAVERAAKRVPGVRSIANDLRVASCHGHTDTEIAREALHGLRNNRAIPLGVQAVVSNGFITLDGTVSTMHQRLAAESAVKYISGVKGVANDIRLEVAEWSSPWLA